MRVLNQEWMTPRVNDLCYDVILASTLTTGVEVKGGK